MGCCLKKIDYDIKKFSRKKFISTSFVLLEGNLVHSIVHNLIFSYRKELHHKDLLIVSSRFYLTIRTCRNRFFSRSFSVCSCSERECPEIFILFRNWNLDTVPCRFIFFLNGFLIEWFIYVFILQAIFKLFVNFFVLWSFFFQHLEDFLSWWNS